MQFKKKNSSVNIYASDIVHILLLIIKWNIFKLFMKNEFY